MAGEILQALTENGTFNKREYQALTLAFFRTIEKSYVDDKSRPTRAETKRRFEMLEKTFRVLRSDYSWGMQRILDELPRSLRCQLDGAPWEPQKSNIWVPPT